jgi:Kef-type K+ transport system membrane component KefB
LTPDGTLDPIGHVLFALAVILAAAKIAGHVSVRFGQPAVLGELVAGVALGNLRFAGIDAFHGIAENPAVDILARLGVVILLFEVGLESTVRDMFKVGWPSLFVAVLGVAAPFALGWGVSAWLLPDSGPYVHAFIGATLTATSVGITARVLQDLGRSRSPEARVILGAAVIDDVLGLVILAVVSGIITSADRGEGISYRAIGLVLGTAAAFLFTALALGVTLSRRIFGLAARLRGSGVLLATALIFCFGLAYLASIVGLAPIVGAYAAGLILEEAHFRPFVNRGEQELEHLLHPISAFLVPVFFVFMGMHIDLTAFARVNVLGLSAMLTIAAIVGKQACSLGALGQKLDRLTIGIGMIPRGEVGLIFANIGLNLHVAGQRVVDEGVFSAVVIMVIATTIVTPPALKWSLARHAGDRQPR